MENELIIRVYNVRFGDAILVSVPDEDVQGKPRYRHILIDLGNVQGGEGGLNELFGPVLDDILEVLNGQPLDLYILTHEHLDHAQGLLWAEKKYYKGAETELKDRLNVQHAWLPASAAPDYYATHPEARERNLEAAETYRAIQRFRLSAAGSSMQQLDVLLQNNSRYAAASGLQLSHGRTADCVAYLAGLAGANTHYVYRSFGADGPFFELDGKHNFRKARFRIWGPEEDTSAYYGRFSPMALEELPPDEEQESTPVPEAVRKRPIPPPGVDMSAFYNLVEFRKRGIYENMLAIDRAANNSSIVFSLEWGGWTLLFPGDAEIRSWREMNRAEVLGPVDFLKVSHHASHNGTPGPELLHKLFPPEGVGQPRFASVSTWEDTYNNIPDLGTIAELEELGVEVKSNLGSDDLYREFRFEVRA